ncbi:MAG: hypothetical protein GY892_00660 [Shimia sp.]|nr:hypothetical protein [Shimia sp.]
MRDFENQKPLIFIHVPKTAGGAVRQIVKDWFPNRFHRHYYNESAGGMPDLLPLKSEQFIKYPPVIFGHFNRNRGFGIEDYYPDVSQFVTILRDPFEVAISHYFFVRKVSEHWKDQSRVPGVSLEEHIKVTGLNMLNHFPREMSSENFKDILEEYFIEIGITEELSKSLGLISKKLGVEFDPFQLEVVNVTERDQPLPEEYRDQFYDKHPLEYAVYEFAKSRLAGMTAP